MIDKQIIRALIVSQRKLKETNRKTSNASTSSEIDSKVDALIELILDRVAFEISFALRETNITAAIEILEWRNYDV